MSFGLTSLRSFDATPRRLHRNPRTSLGLFFFHAYSSESAHFVCLHTTTSFNLLLVVPNAPPMFAFHIILVSFSVCLHHLPKGCWSRALSIMVSAHVWNLMVLYLYWLDRNLENVGFVSLHRASNFSEDTSPGFCLYKPITLKLMVAINVFRGN